MICKLILIFYLANQALTQYPSQSCTISNDNFTIGGDLYKEISSEEFRKFCKPPLEETVKGDSGKIGIIGGCTEYTGKPFFTAISALKAGADLVYIITTQSAAPVIKSYSPDLIVYPFLHSKFLPKLKYLITRLDIFVIGPGLGRSEDTLDLLYELIYICRKKRKPLVIDADGLYAISKNVSVLEQYPSPGVILTPNHNEAERLKLSVPSVSQYLWVRHWGDYVSVLVKGKSDTFYSTIPLFDWHLDMGGSARRSGGQGDILAGVLGTFYHWAIKSEICSNIQSVQLAQSLAAAAASNMTRMCNALTYNPYGRSMMASDMIKVIHKAFDIFMNKPLRYIDYRFSS